jgi:hypothetical protein
MAKKKSLISMLADNNISFDFIQNEKGLKAYEDDFVSIDADNADEYAKTGNFSGLSIYSFTPDEIPNFDKVCTDAGAWTYTLPITEIALSEMTEKQVLALLGVVGGQLNSLTLNYTKFNKIELDKIVKACPKLSKLELSDDNWERDNRLPVELDKIGKQKFESIICRQFAIFSQVDWSALNIEALEFDECETSLLTLPNKLRSFKTNTKEEKVTITGAAELKDLSLFADNEEAVQVNLSNLKGLEILDLQIAQADGANVSLPTSLKSLKLQAAIEKKCSLDFIENLSNLESLEIVTTSKSFADFDKVSNLKKLKKFSLDENGVGENGFKSAFKPEILEGLKELAELELRSVVNTKDLKFLKSLPSLSVFNLMTSRLATLDGLESSTVEKLHLHDCGAIGDLSKLCKSPVKDFKYYISGFWGHEVELSPKGILTLVDSGVNDVEINLDKVKMTKKDFKSIEKTFAVELEDGTLFLERK